ncbi:MAG TPA: hypothetical protein VEC13_01950 [Candidatus Paceibacterota bacterium]|nr:hypothetical protein [Candidatus Paceibacterota bacterium]
MTTLDAPATETLPEAEILEILSGKEKDPEKQAEQILNLGYFGHGSRIVFKLLRVLELAEFLKNRPAGTSSITLPLLFHLWMKTTERAEAVGELRRRTTAAWSGGDEDMRGQRPLYPFDI